MTLRSLLLLISLLSLGSSCARMEPVRVVEFQSPTTETQPSPPEASDVALPPRPEPPVATTHRTDALMPVGESALRYAEAATEHRPVKFETDQVLDGGSYGLVGDGMTENTATLRGLLEGGNRTVRIPPGDYVTGQLHLSSRTVLILEPGAILRDSGRLAPGAGLLHIGESDVHIKGFGARIIGTPERYTTRSTHHGVGILGATNVLLEGLESNGHSGSGFHISGVQDGPATDVLLLACAAANNGSGGLTITSARRLRVVGCEFANQNGSPNPFGVHLKPLAPTDILDDVILFDAHTESNLGGGIMVDLQSFDNYSEPATAIIVEHVSTGESDELLLQVAPGTRAAVRYSSRTQSTPRQDWQALKEASGAIVLSYYWPVEKGKQDFYELSMSSPGAIDILPSAGHGSADVRSYWSRRGKILLSRVYPFRTHHSEQELYAYFAENIQSSAGISLDEVIAHQLRPAQRWILERVLTRIRSEFPTKLIVVWDASQWNNDSARLLRAIRDQADAIILETYISQGEARYWGYGRFERKLEVVESHAPGITSKVLLGLGAYGKMRDGRTDSFAEHLEEQVRFIATTRELCGVGGIGIYAPVYLSPSEQHRLDVVIRSELQTGTVRPACIGVGDE